jgi:hypothetical protein
MTNKFTANSLAAAITAALCGNVWAVDPQSIDVTDGIKFTPVLEIAQRYDDNIRAAEFNTDSSWVTTIAPTFKLSTEGRNSAYALTYTPNSEIYSSESDYDNTDHFVDLDAAFQFNDRNRLKLNAGYDRVEDIAQDTFVFGTVGEDGFVEEEFDFQGNSDEPDKYTLTTFNGNYLYGADTALMQLELDAGYEELRYRNSGDINDDLERNTTPLSATGYYRVAPKTRLLLEGRYTDFDYTNDDTQDSYNTGLLGGVTWEATAMTTGTIKIGAEEKNFDNSGIDNENNTMWEAGINWSPLTYSKFNLTTRQNYTEGDDGADAIERQATTLSWNHQWLERVSSDVMYGYVDEEYLGINRTDTTDVWGLGLTYEMRRWLDVGIGWKYAERDSDAIGESYDRNIYAINFKVSL